jgi:lipopolysaccharide assembly protein A
MKLSRGSENPTAASQPGDSEPPGQPTASAPPPAGQPIDQYPEQQAVDQPDDAAPSAASALPVTPAAPAAPGPRAPAQHVVKRTRVGGVWVASALFALVLLLLLIFILENSAKVKISFFGASGHLPLGVALLFAAVLGILLVVLPGTARIIQLRRTARRHRKVDSKNAKAAAAASPPPAAGPGAPS